MTFSAFATVLEKLEKTASRNSMTEVLAQFFAKTDASDIGKIMYLLQGRVAPLFAPIEFGVADKMMMRAIASGLSVEEEIVRSAFKETGDLGKTAERIKNQESRIKNKKLSVSEVFDLFLYIAQSIGSGSQEKKINALAKLISEEDPLSARYIVRIPLNKLRLGFSDMTILDALSWMLAGDKSQKKELEKAYHVRPDLGFIATTVKKKGLAGLSHIVPDPGTPILMARANRLSSAEEITEKIGKCAIEFKYDGLRLQVHKKGKETHMFSRNLEDVTHMFPDIAEAISKQISAESVIFEGEVVAYNPETHVFVSFQQTMQRKRKYDIAAKAAEIPVKLFAFELLYADGNSFLEKPYIERKEKLKSIIKKGTTIVYAQETIVDDALTIESLFDESVTLHFEGIIAKKLDGKYEAGMRGWSWIKFKKAMSKKLSDTVDLVVMGYTRGQGKRTVFGVGQFLTGVYDTEADRFVTVTKIGTGLTDAQFHEFSKRVKKLMVKERPKNYDVDKLLIPDVWILPQLVVEVGSDEITRSAVHTAGRTMQPSKSGKALSVKESGYALRFPRLVRFRDDKQAIDVTTVTEMQSMYKKQKK